MRCPRLVRRSHGGRRDEGVRRATILRDSANTGGENQQCAARRPPPALTRCAQLALLLCGVHPLAIATLRVHVHVFAGGDLAEQTDGRS